MFRAALAVFKHQVIAYPWLVLSFVVIFAYPRRFSGAYLLGMSMLLNTVT